MTKLVMADTRSENAEMDIGRLNVRIDKVDDDGDYDCGGKNMTNTGFAKNIQLSTPPQVEEDLVVEKSKIKQVSDDLNAVFEDLM